VCEVAVRQSSPTAGGIGRWQRIQRPMDQRGRNRNDGRRFGWSDLVRRGDHTVKRVSRSLRAGHVPPCETLEYPEKPLHSIPDAARLQRRRTKQRITLPQNATGEFPELQMARRRRMQEAPDLTARIFRLLFCKVYGLAWKSSRWVKAIECSEVTDRRRN
jgi:hypothetical protein